MKTWFDYMDAHYAPQPDAVQDQNVDTARILALARRKAGLDPAGQEETKRFDAAAKTPAPLRAAPSRPARRRRLWAAAVAAALVNPRKDALLQLNITSQERARLNALIMASTIAFSSPFGYLAGWLSSMDRRLPFVFTFLLFVTAMLIIGRIQEPQVEEEQSA